MEGGEEDDDPPMNLSVSVASVNYGTPVGLRASRREEEIRERIALERSGGGNRHI